MSDATNVVEFAHHRMSDAEYEAARAFLRQMYGDNRKEMVAKYDQAMAALFEKSGWTQDQLAAKEGKSQPWVVTRLRFGRFLQFITNVISQDSLKHLTEGLFRQYWEKTDGDERDRFRAVRQMIEEDAAVGKKGPNLRGPIKEKFGDGKWHSVAAIAKGVENDDVEYVAKALRDLKTAGKNPKVEQRKHNGVEQYRIFHAEKTVGTVELTEKLGPIIDRLLKEGKKHMATMSPEAVYDQALLLRRLLEEWAK